LNLEVVLFSVIAIRIGGYPSHCYVIDNHLDIGIDAGQGNACRSVEGYVVLIAALDTVDLHGGIS
jgi:hypothetical protein